MYNEVLFQFAWIKYDDDKNGELNLEEFKNLAEFLLTKINESQGN